MKIGTVQFDSALFLGATFKQEKLISDTLYAAALRAGELLKGWKLDRATGFTRKSTPIPHCRGHSIWLHNSYLIQGRVSLGAKESKPGHI